MFVAMRVVAVICCILLAIGVRAQSQDTVLQNGRKAKFQIEVVPCDCDSSIHDSIAISSNQCFDTSFVLVYYKSILDIADSLALEFKVPPELVYEIGMNESRWLNIYDMDYVIKDGDLQVIDRTFNVFYKQLNLSGGKTRRNYLIIGIYYLRQNYEMYQSWRKARYAYGRGRWRPESEWTRLERSFMNKIDWSKYDTISTTSSDNTPE